MALKQAFSFTEEVRVLQHENKSITGNFNAPEMKQSMHIGIGLGHLDWLIWQQKKNYY